MVPVQNIREVGSEVLLGYNLPVPNTQPLRRLDQMLSSCGYCSRSEARLWVRGGRVLVGGQRAEAVEQKARAADVVVDGEPLDSPEGILVLLHKPAGHVCSHDTKEGPRVFDLLPPRWLKRNPPITSVGRLDKDATGALVISDQGELVHRWTSPKRHVTKLYEVTVDRDLDASLIGVFAAGELVLEDEHKPCLPAKLEIVSAREARLELTEGKYHQVKRMFASQGWTVMRLHRSRFGEFDLGDLPVGQWRRIHSATD
ncbi:MAG: rRNA pseudouridine synthase [Verrucomicrobia bacterium]|nr:rRNA pseudouridine synthase [Verrucomicrobiota bacterium]